MSEESQPVAPQEENPPAPQPPSSIPPQPQKSKKNILMIAAVVVAVLCLCSVICLAVFGTSMFQVYTEKAPVEAVLDDYMLHMANKDADSAYALFSPRAQRQFSVSDVEEMLEGNNYVLFEGYRSLSVSTLNILAAVNTDSDAPQGTVAKVTGVIDYDDGVQGSFAGTLEKVDDKWMIHGINVTVPPSKLK